MIRLDADSIVALHIRDIGVARAVEPFNVGFEVGNEIYVGFRTDAYAYRFTLEYVGGGFVDRDEYAYRESGFYTCAFYRLQQSADSVAVDRITPEMEAAANQILCANCGSVGMAVAIAVESGFELSKKQFTLPEQILQLLNADISTG